MYEKIIEENKLLNIYRGSSNASFGELLQGVSIDNDDFLVTLPIDLHTTATLIHDPQSANLVILPEYKSKVRKFIDLLSTEFNVAITGTLIIESNIPEGKGLSSSTADLVATFRAIESFSKIEFDLEKINQIFRKIEPSDGLLYAGSVIYKHKKCSFVKKLGNFPKTNIIAIDEGGVLDTISYNKVKKDYNEEDKVLYGLLLSDLEKSFATNDFSRIGFIATQSALINQRFNNKKNLIHSIGILSEIDALGIITTHSGTCIGIILNPEHADVQNIFNKIKDMFPNDNVVLYRTL